MFDRRIRVGNEGGAPRFWLSLLLPVAVAGLALLAAACAGSGESAAPHDMDAPTMSMTDATSTPAPEARSTPTGIAAIDEVVFATLAGHVDHLHSLVRRSSVACVSEQTGMGAAPVCEGAEARGSMVEVFPVAECEGNWVRPADIHRTLQRVVGVKPALYAVYRLSGSTWPPGDYEVVFAATVGGQEKASRLIIADGRLAGVDLGCAETPRQLSESRSAGDIVLAPANTEG